MQVAIGGIEGGGFNGRNRCILARAIARDTEDSARKIHELFAFVKLPNLSEN